MLNWMLYNVKEMFRDKANLFFILVFPILMVAILGNMLSELDNPDTPIGTIKIAAYIENPQSSSGAAANEHMGLLAESMAVSSFVETLSEHEGIDIVKTSGAEAARTDVKSGTADAAMIFHSPLSLEVTEGTDVYRNRAVMLISQSFSREYSAFKAAALHDPKAFTEIMEMNSGAIPDMSGLAIDKDLGVSRTMIDYYAVTMVIMIAFMGGGIGGASSMFIMRQDGSLRRLSASPRSRSRLFMESVIGGLPQSIIQAGVIMLLSIAFLGAHYARTWQGNMLIFAFFIVLGLAVGAVFMLIGLFVKVNPYIPILAILWALLFISGTFSKDMFIEGFSEYLPMSIAQQAVFDFTVFGRYGQLLMVMAVSAAVFGISCVIGSALYKRKETMF